MGVGVNVPGNVWEVCVCCLPVILDVVLWVRRAWVVVIFSLSLYARNTVFKE